MTDTVEIIEENTVVEINGQVTVISVGIQGPPGEGGGTGDVDGPATATDNAVARFDGTTGKLLQNSAATISDGGELNTTGANLDYLQLDTAATPTAATGLIRWNATEGSAELGLEGGNVQGVIGQQMYAKVRNAEATSLAKGEVVYLYGASGNRGTVKRASNTSDTTSAKTFGLVAEAIAPNATGLVITQGVIEGLNLGAPFTEGDTLWLGSTAGTFTRTKPTQPNHLVFIGIVERANAGNGQAYIKPQNGYELDEIHDVLITSPQSGNTLIYDQAAGLWKNSNLTDGTNITIAEGAGSITVGVSLSAGDKLLGRTTAGAGAAEEITLTAAGRALLDDADATAQRTTLGLGTLATQNGTFSGTSSGTNTGDQTISLTGDVTGSGTGTFAATIAAGAVTLAKQANVASGSVFYRKSANSGAPETQTLATLKTDLGLSGTNSGDQTITLTGDVTGGGTGTFAATIANGAVGLAKQANVATGTLFYRKSAGSGAPEVQTLATLKTDLDLAGTNSGDQLVFSTVAVAGQPDCVADTTSDTLTLVAGTNITLTTSGDSVTINAAGGGVTDGDKTDITVSSGGTVWQIDNNAVTYSKIQQVPQDKLLGRKTASTGTVEEIDCTPYARTLLDDAAAGDARTTLGLGTLATQSGTFSGNSSGTNTGDQNTFQTIAVAGQTSLTANTTTDTLNIAAAGFIEVTTTPGTDTVTIGTNGAQKAITSGTAAPSGGADGDIYLQYV